MNYEQALLDPASYFSNPEAVYSEASLTRTQKLQLLQRWEYDARELEVAEEENMAGGPPSRLREISLLLQRLEASHDLEHVPPTKQGGI